MPAIKDGDYSEVKTLLGRVEPVARAAASLQTAAQACAEEVYSYFRESLVLFRVYGTVAYEELPEDAQRFARGVAEAQGVASLLRPRSIVLALLGTAGEQTDWNDRLQSRGHLAIPLVASSFVENLPMVAALMKDMGLGLDWLDRGDNSIVVREVGRLARVFFVADSRTAVDAQGRKVVPAGDFVHDHGVRTVFGLGGGYIDGTFLAMMFFTRELIERRQVEAFMPLINFFKMATLGKVRERKIFA